MGQVLTAVDLIQGAEDDRARDPFYEDDIKEAIICAGIGRDPHAMTEGAAIGNGDHVGAAFVPVLMIQTDLHGLRTVGEDGLYGRF